MSNGVVLSQIAEVWYSFVSSTIVPAASNIVNEKILIPCVFIFLEKSIVKVCHIIVLELVLLAHHLCQPYITSRYNEVQPFLQNWLKLPCPIPAVRLCYQTIVALHVIPHIGIVWLASQDFPAHGYSIAYIVDLHLRVKFYCFCVHWHFFSRIKSKAGANSFEGAYICKMSDNCASKVDNNDDMQTQEVMKVSSEVSSTTRAQNINVSPGNLNTVSLEETISRRTGHEARIFAKESRKERRDIWEEHGFSGLQSLQPYSNDITRGSIASLQRPVVNMYCYWKECKALQQCLERLANCIQEQKALVQKIVLKQDYEKWEGTIGNPLEVEQLFENRSNEGMLAKSKVTLASITEEKEKMELLDWEVDDATSMHALFCHQVWHNIRGQWNLLVALMHLWGVLTLNMQLQVLAGDMLIGTFLYITELKMCGTTEETKATVAAMILYVRSSSKGGLKPNLFGLLEKEGLEMTVNSIGGADAILCISAISSNRDLGWNSRSLHSHTSGRSHAIEVSSVGAVILLSALIVVSIHPTLAASAFAGAKTSVKAGSSAAIAVGGKAPSTLLRTELLSSAWTGFFAGCLHTLSGPDHLAALAPLSIGRTRMESAAVGALWGCGHDAGQVIFGILFLLLKDRLHIEVIRTWGTRVVGMTLLVIGGMGIKEASEIPTPCVALDGGDCEVGILESAQSLTSGKRKIGFATFATGIVHGLQPDALMMVLPALALPSRVAGAAFLSIKLYSVGTFAGCMYVDIPSREYCHGSTLISWKSGILIECIMFLSTYYMIRVEPSTEVLFVYLARILPGAGFS
eukprot:Gb_04161 [translate_table: standard]